MTARWYLFDAVGALMFLVVAAMKFWYPLFVRPSSSWAFRLIRGASYLTFVYFMYLVVRLRVPAEHRGADEVLRHSAMQRALGVFAVSAALMIIAMILNTIEAGR